MFNRLNAGRGRLYLSVVNCEQLKAWCAGKMKTLDDYGFVMAPNNAINRKIHTSRAVFVKTMERQLNRISEARWRAFKADEPPRPGPRHVAAPEPDQNPGCAEGR